MSSRRHSKAGVAGFGGRTGLGGGTTATWVAAGGLGGGGTIAATWVDADWGAGGLGAGGVAAAAGGGGGAWPPPSAAGRPGGRLGSSVFGGRGGLSPITSCPVHGHAVCCAAGGQ